MKRNIKNIVMIVILILVSCSFIFTVGYAKNNSTNKKNDISNGMNSMPNNGQDFNKQNDNSNTQSDNSSDSNSTNNDSNKESNNSNNQAPDKPNDNSSNNQVPDKPNDNSSNNQAPDKPGSDNSSNGVDNNGGNGLGQMPNMSSSLSCWYYVIFGVQGLVISIIIVYLVMSLFNKKSFKETFVNRDKVIINILSVIIFTMIFTYSSFLITDKLISSNSNVTMNSNVSYSSTKKINSNTKINSGTYKSSSSNQNALLVTGKISASFNGINVLKTGSSSSSDETSFYGTNSAVIAKDGAKLTISSSTITTNATGSNGLFSYGGNASTSNSKSDGTTVIVKNSTIKTSKDNSGGIMTTGGGNMKAYNLKISTKGTSSAAIRSDRGGGSVIVDKGTYETTGQGSPTIYSTADITVKNATLKASASEGVVIEGKNKVVLENVKLTDTNNKLNGQSTTYKNIFLYQSMSGDADTGVSSFSAKNSTITTNKGDSFYITNTKAKITLENNKIINNDKTGYFLRSQKDSWGKSSSNGGDVTLILKNQSVTGDIYIDSISTLDINMKNNSVYTGTINGDNTAKSIKLTLSKNSKIKLTGDSYISDLSDSDSSYSNIDFNGYKLYVNGKAIN